jgi:hypothetical protein
MTFVIVMWAVWGALVVIMAAIYLYRGRLTRDEDDQIFLDDSFSHEKIAQEAIAAKVDKVQPWLTTFKWLVVLATVFIIGYYIWDIYTQFK